MKNFLKVVFFSLLLITLFSVFSNYGIPEIQPAAPPSEEKLDLGSMTMEQYIAVGEKIVNGKGTCILCHNAVGGRAPLLEKLVITASERLQDPRYQGKATDLESYILESMLEPSAYVVTGFGKAGTNDGESPMPSITGGSIDLSTVESGAVIAYLQDMGGAEVTVELPTETVEMEESAETAAAAAEPLKTAEEIVAKYGCGACHKIAGQVGAVGPGLDTIGATRDADYLRRAILDPNADIAEGYPPGLMPPNYGAQLFAQELEILVSFMAKPTSSSPSASGDTAASKISSEAADVTKDNGDSGAGGEALMISSGCGACHKFSSQVGAIGPDLSKIGALRDSEYLRRSILQPNADIAEGYFPNLMPPVYAAQLSTEELDMIVEYLTGLK